MNESPSKRRSIFMEFGAKLEKLRDAITQNDQQTEIKENPEEKRTQRTRKASVLNNIFKSKKNLKQTDLKADILSPRENQQEVFIERYQKTTKNISFEEVIETEKKFLYESFSPSLILNIMKQEKMLKEEIYFERYLKIDKEEDRKKIDTEFDSEVIQWGILKFNIQGIGKYYGNLTNNIPNGNGKIIYENGDTYMGEWKNGYSHGRGQSSCKNFVYKGDWKFSKMSGKGVIKYENGDVYKGDFKNDLYNGEGSYIWKENGNEYFGEFKNNLKHGKGYFIWNGKLLFLQNVDKYALEGYWENDKLIYYIDNNENPNDPDDPFIYKI
jgi:hypothetical protein